MELWGIADKERYEPGREGIDGYIGVVVGAGEEIGDVGGFVLLLSREHCNSPVVQLLDPLGDDEEVVIHGYRDIDVPLVSFVSFGSFLLLSMLQQPDSVVELVDMLLHVEAIGVEGGLSCLDRGDETMDEGLGGDFNIGGGGESGKGGTGRYWAWSQVTLGTLHADSNGEWGHGCVGVGVVDLEEGTRRYTVDRGN